MVALWLVPLKHCSYLHTIGSQRLRPAWSLNSAGSSWGGNFYRCFMCHGDQKSEPGLWKKDRRKDIHFCPLKETLHWPIKKWKISPCKPMTIILTGPFSSDLFQPFSLRYLNVIGDQLPLWLWGEAEVYPKGYRFKRPFLLNPLDFWKTWMQHWHHW